MVIESLSVEKWISLEVVLVKVIETFGTQNGKEGARMTQTTSRVE